MQNTSLYSFVETKWPKRAFPLNHHGKQWDGCPHGAHLHCLPCTSLGQVSVALLAERESLFPMTRSLDKPSNYMR